MTVKIIIDRRFKNPAKAEDIRIFNELRIGAMGYAGYVSGETLVDVEDSRNIVVISIWSNLDDWNVWRDSKQRKRLESELAANLEEPAKINVFKPGVDSLQEILKQVMHDAEVAA